MLELHSENYPPRQRGTVEARWEARIAQEDAERDIIVWDMRRAKAQREGGDWRLAVMGRRYAEDRYHHQWKMRRRLEQRKSYREGMDELDERFSLTMSHES